jgi:hypothetical protein
MRQSPAKTRTRINAGSKACSLNSASQPDTVSYLVFRLADDSFLHVSFHNHGDDDVNPISSTAAFAHFQDRHGDRRLGDVNQQSATLVGAYITEIA